MVVLAAVEAVKVVTVAVAVVDTRVVTVVTLQVEEELLSMDFPV
jgi:hypothetical protein